MSVLFLVLPLFLLFVLPGRLLIRIFFYLLLFGILFFILKFSGWILISILIFAFLGLLFPNRKRQRKTFSFGFDDRARKMFEEEFFRRYQESYQQGQNFQNRDATAEDYQILGINENATNSQIKRAYYSTAKKYHPDSYSSMSEAEKKNAEEKFKKVNNAYQKIKKQRNIS